MLNTKDDSAKIVSIEYGGVGSKPFFVIEINGEVKFIPIEPGVTRLEDIEIK
tara:strand:- start:174 stop:329 length:156 start_codon:yes stop_codon:yes gene_type:complete